MKASIKYPSYGRTDPGLICFLLDVIKNENDTLLLLQTTFELMWLILYLVSYGEGFLQGQLDFWGWEYIPDEVEIAAYVRDALYLLYYLLIAFRGKCNAPDTRAGFQWFEFSGGGAGGGGGGGGLKFKATNYLVVYSTDVLRRGPVVSLILCYFVVYSKRRFVLRFAWCYFVLVFFSPLNIWGQVS